MALERAIASIGESPLSPLEVRFKESGNEEGVLWESLTLDDGHPPAYVQITWQTLTGNEDKGAFAGEFGVTSEQDGLSVLIDDRTSVGINHQAVRVYDESKIVSVLAFEYQVLGIDDLRTIAEQLFAQLP